MERGRPGEGGISFTFIGGSYPEIYSTRGGSPFQASCEETQSCLGLDLPSSQHVTIPPHGSENKCETSNNPVGLNRRWVTAFIKVSSRRPHTQDDPARGGSNTEGSRGILPLLAFDKRGCWGCCWLERYPEWDHLFPRN